jgi:two-component system sensor histidine kinase UhpB
MAALDGMDSKTRQVTFAAWLGRRPLARLGLFILVAQTLFWSLYAAPWGPVNTMASIDRIETTSATIATLNAPTLAAADAATHDKVNLPYTDCCGPTYLSLKTGFILDEIPVEGLGLIAYQQVDNFIIRLNGTVIHSVGEMEFGEQSFHGQRAYLLRLPSGLLKAGENEVNYITVRHGFPYTDLVAPLIGPYEQVRAATALRFWQAHDLRLLGGCLTFILGLFALIMLFRAEDKRFAAWLLILSWSWSALAAYGLYFDLPFGGVGRMIAFYAVNTLVGASLVCFIDTWTRKPLPWGQTVIEFSWFAVNGVIVFCLLTLPMPTGYDIPNSLWSWYTLALGVLVVARLIWHFATAGEARHVEAALISIIAVCLALDAIGDSFGLLAGGYLIDAAPLLLLAFVAAFVQRNFVLFQSAVGLNRLLESQLEKREQELAEAHARERDLIGYQARSEERRRMMRDMHDGVGGQLVGLLLSVRRGALDNAAVIEGLQSAMDEIRLMIDSTDATGASLDAMLAVFETRVRPRVQGAGLDFIWRDERKGAADLAPATVLQVFRIMQESVTNALKHSGGSKIEVVIENGEDGSVQIKVSDDGKGLSTVPIAAANADQPAPGSSHGLGNMGNRAQMIGAELGFISAEPGLCIRLILPAHVLQITDVAQAA